MARNAQTGAGSSGPWFPSIGRRTLASLCCAPLAAVAVGIAAMHGGGSGKAEAAANRVIAPACASAERGIAPPPEISAAVLPPETIVTSVTHPRPGMTLVNGVIARPFRAAVGFFVTKLPAAGYINTSGDAEMDEAESFFAGPGVHGKWKVNGIQMCPGAVTLALFVRT